MQNYSFDPDYLRDKYRQERDKRLREDGNDQYQEVSGDFSYFVDDPYINEAIERQTITDSYEIVIIGGGFGGVLAASRLKEAGFSDFKIIEKGGNFGGTWYWNRYPGASCDIESYIYFPLLEETKFIPGKKYTNAPETLEYFDVISEKFGLNEHAIFQTEVNDVRWKDDERLWEINTNKGDKIKCNYVVHANGPLNRPKLPAINGINDYKGHTFHTSRWDYQYTGGSSKGNLSNLKDKRVAVIGTGATAVQCIPHLAESAKQLYVFQRTPSSIDERNNTETNEDWFLNQSPGWQAKRRENFEGFLTGNVNGKDLVNDGWTEVFRRILGAMLNNGPSKFRIFLWTLGSVFSRKLYTEGLRSYLQGKFMSHVGVKNLAKQVEMADFEKME